MTTLGVLAGFLLLRRSISRVRRSAEGGPDFDPLRLALLMRIGLSSGLSLPSTLAMAAPHVDRATAEVIGAVFREGLPGGLTTSLMRQTNESMRLFRMLADAHLSGAPLVFAINAFITDELERERAASLQRARVLPVRLTVPVALGLLPGFILVGVAPQIVLALHDLVGQVTGL